MKSTLAYIKEWQKALQIEIQFLKKYGSTKYLLSNGHLLSKDISYTYFFETNTLVRIPVGSSVKLEWGTIKNEGRILSSEGKNVIIACKESLGDQISEIYVFHDPWELLDQLFERLEEIKENKKKRARIKRLMAPNMPTKHPAKYKSNVHELLLRSKYNPVTFVWGPPGTGKTYTLARVAANKYFKKKKVLLLSHSNQSVDVLMKEIAEFISKRNRYREGDVLRYGSQVGELLNNLPAITTSQLLQNRDPELALEKEAIIGKRKLLKLDLSKSFSKRDSKSLLEIETRIARVLEKIRQKEVKYLQDAFIVGTTLAKAASDPAIYEKDFDLVIVDEASMAYVPQTAFAATIAKRMIICGDFKQLPPIASARHELVEKWLREDIFHCTGVESTVEKGAWHPHLLLLKEQRRMHPAISSFTNRFIYHSLVGDHQSVYKKRAEIASRNPFPASASTLINSSFSGEYALMDSQSKSRINLWHLLLSFQLIHEAYTDGARSIGYISPYRAQATWMDMLIEDIYQSERESADIVAATVHRFQGSERDVMVFDSVDSFPLDRPGMLLVGKQSERLINVAITRTKGKFLHVCDTSFITSKVSAQKTIRKLVEDQQTNHHLVLPHEIGTWVKHHHPCLQWMHARKVDRVIQDIMEAKKSITIGLPCLSSLPKEWKEKLNRRNSRVALEIIGNNLVKANREEEMIRKDVSFPFIIIDGRIMWVGVPLEAAVRVRPPYVSVRIESEALCGQLLKQY